MQDAALYQEGHPKVDDAVQAAGVAAEAHVAVAGPVTGAVAVAAVDDTLAIVAEHSWTRRSLKLDFDACLGQGSDSKNVDDSAACELSKEC